MARKMPKQDQVTIVRPGYSYSYSVSHGGTSFVRPRHRLTSPTEIRDIAAAIAVLSIGFFYILYIPNDRGIPFYATLAVVSVVAGFFIHEMSHKLVARSYGCWAEFRADYRMLGLALVMSFFGFLFAAPGAVLIMGNIDSRQNGRISLAGPGSNLLIAAACVPFWTNIVPGVPEWGSAMAWSLYFFSAFLAAFNMIPLMPFDGAKVWHWNKAVYVVALLAAGLMLLVALGRSWGILL